MPLNKLQRHLTYLEQDSQNVNLLLSISDCYWQMGDFSSAQDYLQAAKKYSANPHELIHLEAKLLHQNQQLDEAIALLEKAIPYCDNNADALGLLALLYFDNNDELNAREITNKTLSLEPNHPNGLLVNLLLKSLHNEATPDEIESLLKLHPQESRLWFVLGTTQLRLMNCPEAEQAFTQVTQLDPEFYDSWICLGWCHQLQNNLEAAENAYQFAINLHNNRADGFEGLAVVKALQNKLSDATNLLSQTNQQDPESFFAKFTQMLLATTLDEEVQKDNS